jgi:hypothetical protein
MAGRQSIRGKKRRPLLQTRANPCGKPLILVRRPASSEKRMRKENMLYVGKTEAIFQANSNEPLFQAGLCVKFTSGSEDLIVILPPASQIFVDQTACRIMLTQ